MRTKRTGGLFLVDMVGSYPVFSRECFSDEQREIQEMVEEFAVEKIKPSRDNIEKQDKDLSLQLLREMGELGLLSIDIPEKYDGMELDKTTSAIVVEAVGKGNSGSFSVIFSVQTGIGMFPIIWFGTDEQKKKYLPKLATAEFVSAYALTEPSSGSDATSAKTTAVPNSDGKYYILNGEKQFITNGGWADVFIVFAQVDGTKFSAFIVDKDTPGFEIGPEEHKMGVKGSSTVPLHLTDVRVPAENLLGNVGDGAAIAFNALNIGRFKLGAADLGGCKEVINNCLDYALERRQFGQSIAYFDAIKKKFSDMIIRTYSLDSVIYRTIGMIDEATEELDKNGPEFYRKMGKTMEEFAIETSIVKVYGSESLGMCADTGIQIHGGYGFIEEYPIAQTYRDTRIDRIWEGTNEINRQIITGYFMKKALMGEIPIREKIKGIDDFLASRKKLFKGTSLDWEKELIEAGKFLTLFVFHEALCEYGQDLRHQHHLVEDLADIFIDLYALDSTVGRLLNNDPDDILLSMLKVMVSEASLRLLDKARLGLNAIYHGQLPKEVNGKLRKFQSRMLPKTDVYALKNQIAEYVYRQKKYPF
ncbi:acyl-CoA dehydrogenase family protein [Patescibacteria group bacterium AH-259-L07]|nr:acyl-CoA dehydrogenase family protein [Patescibacteria group bacterium AH-259-L07]